MYTWIKSFPIPERPDDKYITEVDKDIADKLSKNGITVKEVYNAYVGPYDSRHKIIFEPSPELLNKDIRELCNYFFEALEWDEYCTLESLWPTSGNDWEFVYFCQGV